MSSDQALRRRSFAASVGPDASPTTTPHYAATRHSLAIISRHRLYRDALVATLGSVPALHLACVLTPEEVARCDMPLDIAVVDPRLGADVVTLVDQLRARRPRLRVIVLGAHTRDGASAWAGARVSTYVDPEGSAADIMIAVLRAARAGCEPALDLTTLALTNITPAPPVRCFGTHAGLLTPREQVVLRMAAEGLANKEIARCLKISECTVKNHMHNVLDKMGARRRGEAVARFQRERGASTGFETARLQPARPYGITG
jgi:DNA-binding NarL/FixJ family response regulator